jgi:hypothetical protein
VLGVTDVPGAGDQAVPDPSAPSRIRRWGVGAAEVPTPVVSCLPLRLAVYEAALIIGAGGGPDSRLWIKHRCLGTEVGAVGLAFREIRNDSARGQNSEQLALTAAATWTAAGLLPADAGAAACRVGLVAAGPRFGADGSRCLLAHDSREPEGGQQPRAARRVVRWLTVSEAIESGRLHTGLLWWRVSGGGARRRDGAVTSVGCGSGVPQYRPSGDAVKQRQALDTSDAGRGSVAHTRHFRPVPSRSPTTDP